ncbi:MAG TPA: GNAT family N-acetyltransferase [Blastocatellia bacterium]|nr:GNAT family N-acetyltransferase [Blastocatellia bacterium]
MHTLPQPHTDIAGSCCLAKTPLAAERLTKADEPEVRRFLAERPLQTFGLLGLIADNGLVSPHNRGDFYAYRGTRRQIEGVALIGHNTVIDARSDEAIQLFASLAKVVVNPFLILGQEQQIDRFIECYADVLYKCTTIDRYWLFRQSGRPDNRNPLPGVRLATPSDLELVAHAHAQCGFEETGVDGLALDPDGFMARCARRIARGQTWVWIEQGRLILKLDVMTATPEVAYLESLWVHPEERGKGYGARFINQVGEYLMAHSAAVCLLAQEENHTAHMLYWKAGYEVIDSYRALFCNKTLTA